mgnify:CR=1 FL=1
MPDADRLLQTERRLAALERQKLEEEYAEVIQTIGKTASFYRHNPELKRKAGSPPPWRV